MLVMPLAGRDSKDSRQLFWQSLSIGTLEDNELRIIAFKETSEPGYSNFTFTRRSLTGYHDAIFSAR